MGNHIARPVARLALALVSAPLFLSLVGASAGCLEPTEAFVDISTDSPCKDLDSTGITAGLLGNIEAAEYGTTTSLCSDDGTIGSIVLTPEGGDKEAPFGFKVVASLDGPVDATCVAPEYGRPCIVARRAMRFLPHSPFHVPVRLSQACAGVQCPETQTCVEGICRSPTIDPSDCENGGSCEPEAGIAPPWEQQITGGDREMARHLAIADDGTVALTGNFLGSVMLGGDEFASKGDQDVFIATYSQGGNFRWAESFGGVGNEDLSRVTFDHQGAAYLLVQFADEVDFGGGPLTSAGGSDVGIVKLNAIGSFEWALRFGGAGSDAPASAAVAPDGSVYIVGSFSGSAALGTAKIDAQGGLDAFILCLTPTGDLRWIKSFGGPGEDAATGVAVDAMGNVYVSGYFTEIVNFGGLKFVKPEGKSDSFLMSYDATGERRWSTVIASSGTDLISDVAARGDRIVVTGRAGNGLKVGGKIVDVQGNNGVVASFTAGGKLSWLRTFGGPSDGMGNAVAIAPDGSIVVGGDVNGSSVFGSDPADSKSILSPFVAVLEASGEPRWSRVFSTSSMKFGTATGAGAPKDGFAYIAGWFTGDLEVGEKTLKSSGAEDAFLLRIAPPPPPPPAP